MPEIVWTTISLPIVAVIAGGWISRLASRRRGKAADAGEPVPAPAEEAHCHEFVRRVAEGSIPAGPELPPALLIGPGLWARLSGAKGLPVLGRLHVCSCPAGPEEAFLEGRALEGEDRARFLAATAVRELLRPFARGQARAATQAERGHHCVVNSEAVRGRPVTIVEHGLERLLLHREEPDGDCWLDLLSGYPVSPLSPEDVARIRRGAVR